MNVLNQRPHLKSSPAETTDMSAASLPSNPAVGLTNQDREPTPDYLPARLLNEFVYCPRLFYYEWVEGVFAESADTVEGSLRHQKLERKDDALPSAEEAEASGEKIHSRSVTLSSETYRLIAKVDLVEGDGGAVSPVDYKRGSPKESGTDGTPQA